MFYTTLTSNVRKGDRNFHDVYGYRFSWSPLHLTPAELHPLKFSYDKLSDDVFERLTTERGAVPTPDPRFENEAESPKKAAVAGRMGDLYALLKSEAAKGEDKIIQKFWKEVNNVPDWVDWDQIDRGQRVGTQVKINSNN
jgi:hypothetical protein